MSATRISRCRCGQLEANRARREAVTAPKPRGWQCILAESWTDFINPVMTLIGIE